MQANPTLPEFKQSGKLHLPLTETRVDKFLDAAAHKGGAITGLAVMIASLIISFDTLMKTAQAYGFGFFLSILWPLLIDGIILSQSLVVLRRERLGFSTKFNWFLLLTFEAASLLINGAAGWQLGLTPLEMFIGALIHGLPPLSLFLISKSMANDIKDNGVLNGTIRTLTQLQNEVSQTQQRAAQQAEEAQQQAAQQAAETQQRAADLAQQIEAKAAQLGDLTTKEAKLKRAVAKLQRERRAAKGETADKAPAQTSEATTEQARDILTEVWRNGEEISGAELGRRLEKSGTLGRKLKKALWTEISQGETNGDNDNIASAADRIVDALPMDETGRKAIKQAVKNFKSGTNGVTQ